MSGCGYPTIGYGHVVKDDEDFSAGIDEAQAEELLRQDAMIAKRAVLRLINVPLTDGMFDALVSVTYNLGGWALQRSTLRRKINREEHSEVPEQFMRWVWANMAVSSKGWFGGELQMQDYTLSKLKPFQVYVSVSSNQLVYGPAVCKTRCHGYGG